MEERLYASVVGAGSCGPDQHDLLEAACQVGRLLARAGFGVVTGGRGGVMEAASRGCKEGGGLTLGILPGSDRQEANPHVDVAVVTGLSHMRNYLVALNGAVMIAVGGGAGTLSEIALAAKLGRPVVVFGGWAGLQESLPGVVAAHTPQEAVETAARLVRQTESQT